MVEEDGVVVEEVVDGLGSLVGELVVLEDELVVLEDVVIVEDDVVGVAMIETWQYGGRISTLEKERL